VLSYRLLRYINSAASGLRQTITSIEQGLVIMGRDQMYRWLTLLLFGSAQASPYAAALLENALVRGRLMELVGKERFPQGERDGLFGVGLMNSPTMLWLWVGLFAVTTLFSIVTLPVEFDASRRALVWLEGSGLAASMEHEKAKNALFWAADGARGDPELGERHPLLSIRNRIHHRRGFPGWTVVLH